VPDGPARIPGPGELVVAAGVGVTGLPVVRWLAARGARVVVTANRAAPAELSAIEGDVTFAGDLTVPPPGTTLVVTSAGIPPANPLLTAAAAVGIEVIGEVELAWRIDRRAAAGGPAPRPWLVVTGTNGKTTTTGMLESILRASGLTVTACGNIGWPVLAAVLAGGPDALDDAARQDAIAVELSSFQLHWAPSLRPTAGVVLNLAQDHLDWHGSMAAYGADKARALAGEVALAVVDDPGAGGLLAGAAAARTVPIGSAAPAAGGLGVVDGMLTDAAFAAPARPLARVDQVRPPGAHNVTNALAAAGLALAVGVDPAAVAAGLAAFEPGGHRNVPVAQRAGVRYVDDSKATNPHAALASLLAYPRVVWVAGGQLKGAEVDDLVRAVRDRLAGAVLLGVDAPIIHAALSRHAPDVPVLPVPGTDDEVMRSVVSAAARMAAPGDVVLLAPAAASLDMFRSYAARGDAFADAARALPDDRSDRT
jgi:UDP-N-acetylmuramoylalanine--D-glutamate ligase